jgi:uncharacterized protein YggE
MIMLLSTPRNGLAAPPERTITVHGEGQLGVYPDAARVSVGLETVEPTLSAARVKNNRIFRRIVKQAARSGIPNVLVKSSSIRVSLVRETSYPRSRLPRVIGYRVYNSVTIRITSRDPKKLAVWASKMLDRTVAAGANHVRGVEFLRMDGRWAYQKAMLRAIKDARANAQKIAAVSGVALGKLLRVQPRWGSYYPRLSSSWGGYFSRRFAYTQASRAGGGGTGMTVATGKFVVKASVTLVYSLR